MPPRVRTRPSRPGRPARGPIASPGRVALRFRAVALASALHTSAIAAAASPPGVHAFRAADGTPTFADAPPAADGAARTSYAGSYGRAVATASCRGLDAAALDARAERWRPDISAAAARHGLDRALVLAVVRVESCFDPRARSVAGAGGLMQLMPATAASLGVADVDDAAANLEGGSRYLARMLRRYGGDETLALAAYNAGPGNVDRHGGVPPFPETVGYVRRVLAERARRGAPDSGS